MSCVTRYLALMRNVYSTYEAKARLSELLRQVRQGKKTVTISYRGKPVAEMRSIQQKPATVEERLEELEQRGVLVRPSGRRSLKVVEPRAGVLKRFLAERSDLAQQTVTNLAR